MADTVSLQDEIKAIAEMARADGQSRCADHLDRMVRMIEEGHIDSAITLSNSMVQWTLRLVSWSGAFDHAVMARELLQTAKERNDGNE